MIGAGISAILNNVYAIEKGDVIGNNVEPKPIDIPQTIPDPQPIDDLPEIKIPEVGNDIPNIGNIGAVQTGPDVIVVGGDKVEPIKTGSIYGGTKTNTPNEKNSSEKEGTNDEQGSATDKKAEGQSESKEETNVKKKLKKGRLTQEEKAEMLQKWANGILEGSYTGGRTAEEIISLATDPAHENADREIDVKKGMHEADVGLGVEEQGKIEDIVRDPTGKAEFIENDGEGQKWDVKSFNSYFKPSKGGYWTLMNS